MNITAETNERTLCLGMQGRLDAHGALVAQEAWKRNDHEGILCAILDLREVEYLSSAGLRVLVMISRALHSRGGALALAGVQPYCRNVMEMAGFASALPQFATLEEAWAFCQDILRQHDALARWEELECLHHERGTFRVVPGSADRGVIYALGNVETVLYARVTVSDLCSKRFSETEYSIGLGGLGDQIDDYFPIMGEMITIGGTMVWLPTDGNDTADFLIPKTDKGQVTIQTAFNVSLGGHFNELMVFESAREGGTTVSELYRALFDLSRARRKEYRGALGLALYAEMNEVFGSGVRKSPIAQFAPANGETIMSAANIQEWLDCDTTPRHTDVTALICGVGVDLTSDLSAYDQEIFNKVFYIHPGNRGGKSELLHNHAALFRKTPAPGRAASLDAEIRKLVEEGEFLDMRHLLDRSTITRALIGVSYIQEILPDPGGVNKV